ncbi:MAG TPA: hypothetical protein VEP68_01025 [Anaeromyxobacteraceae bacterium]|nr:hypothetical protein [Anaeromyxobacteraceae bacterium]
MSRAGAMAAEAEALARRLLALEEGPVRARAAGRALAGMDPAAAAEAIASLVARADQGGASAVVAAVGQAVLDPQAGLPYEWLAGLYASASELGLEGVRAMLLAPPPQRLWEEPLDKADPRLAHLTLGHKKSLARIHRDPDLLARLAAEGEPVVVQELLRNPQLTEPFAVRIASRRPCRPQTLRCLWQERRWRTRPAVLLALVRNPYLEPEVGLKILPSLAAGELAEIAADGTLHPLLRAVAATVRRDRREPGRPGGEGT